MFTLLLLLRSSTDVVLKEDLPEVDKEGLNKLEQENQAFLDENTTLQVSICSQ